MNALLNSQEKQKTSQSLYFFKFDLYFVMRFIEFRVYYYM